MKYAVIVTCLATVLGALPAHAEGTLQRIERGEAVRQGIANDAPFGYADKSGATVGVEVEMAATLLKELGTKDIEISTTTFGALIPGVQARRFDLVSNGIYIRPERCEVITFAQPHFVISVGAFTRADANISFTSMQELAQTDGLKVGILTGGGESRVYLQAGGKEDQIFDFADRAGLVAGLKSGRIDVGLLTSIGAGAVAANDDALKLVTPFAPLVVDDKPLVSYAAFAFSKDDEEFVGHFNDKLKAFMASPRYPELLARYGVPDSVIPDENVDVQELCTPK